MGLLKIISLSLIYFFFTSIVPLLSSCFIDTQTQSSDNIFLLNLLIIYSFMILSGIFIIKNISLKILYKIIIFHFFFYFSFAALAVFLQLDCYYHDIPFSVFSFLPIIFFGIFISSFILFFIYFIKKIIFKNSISNP